MPKALCYVLVHCSFCFSHMHSAIIVFGVSVGVFEGKMARANLLTEGYL